MNLRFGILLIICALHSGFAWGQAAQRASQFGFVFGFSVPDANNTQPFSISGIKGEAFLTPMLSLGGYYLISDNQGAPSAEDKFRYSVHGVQTTLHVPSGKGDSFFGARIGITKVSTNPNQIDSVFSPYHYGIVAGYDYHLLSWCSLGFEGSYLHVLPGKTTQNGQSVQLDSFNIMNFLVTLQFML